MFALSFVHPVWETGRLTLRPSWLLIQYLVQNLSLSAGWPAVMVHSSKLRIQEEPEYEARLVFGVRPCLKKENLLVGF